MTTVTSGTRRNEAIVAALSNHLSSLSLDPNKVSGKAVEGQDILTLFTGILQLSGGDGTLEDSEEVMKWVKFANDFSADVESRHSVLQGLNEDLACRSVLVGDGLKSSVADVIVYSALHSFVSCLSKSEMQKIPNILRWMDYVQNTEDFGEAFEKIVVEKSTFQHPGLKSGNVPNAGQNSKNVARIPLSGEKKSTENSEAKANIEENASAGNKSSEKKSKVPSEEKKKQGKETSVKSAAVNITVLNIQVGIIRKAWKHPSADSLLVEEIDVGEGKLRQVVSGLAKYFSPDDLTNRRVALITNVKPGKLRDVTSSGLVLCASNQDQTAVEPLLPPEKSILGERILFSGYDGKPEDVLNPKKKQLEKITPDLFTDDKGVATYKGVPFMTSAGPCTSSIPKASIK